MKKLALFTVGLAALLGASAGAQAQCVGDCNNDNTVAINELVTGVNIALGSAAVLTCPSFDANGDGVVAINELITGVNNALGTCPSGEAVCGDGLVNVEGETCDDGNNFGGDNCAANCTTEDARVGVFDSSKTKAKVQAESFLINLTINGQQTYRTGKKRDVTVVTKNGPDIAPGEIPVAMWVSELLFQPVKVTGLVCACVRGVAVEGFGPGLTGSGGITGSGSIGCGDQGLTNVDYRLIQDHNTTPGSPGNFSQGLPGGPGTPNDAECNDTTELPGGLSSSACAECNDVDLAAGLCVQAQRGPCDLPSYIHTNVCNGPRTLTQFGGMVPKGAALILINSSISLLQDAGACSTDGPRGGRCPFPDYGPDCLPCTPDDAVFQEPNLLPTTTGSAEAAVFDANNSAAIIDKDKTCFTEPGVFCKTKFSGSLFDCAALEANPTGGLSGGSLSVTFPSIDANQIGDNVTNTVFFNK